MRIDASTNAQEWSREIANYIAFFGVSRQQAMQMQGRLLGERLVRLTPPKTRAQGRRRVQRDIERLFFGQNASSIAAYLASGRDQGTVSQEDSSIVRLWVDKAGNPWGVERYLYRPQASVSEMTAHHQKHRDKRGRVTLAGTFTRDVGRWKFIDQMVVSEDRLADYTKSKQAMVGQAKGGWARSIIGMGGKVAAWIGDHSSAGSFRDLLDSAEGYLLLENASEWARGGYAGGESARIVETAIASRVRDIATHIQKAEFQAQRKAFRGGQAIAKFLAA